MLPLLICLLDLLQKSDLLKVATAKSLAFAFSQDDFCKRSTVLPGFYLSKMLVFRGFRNFSHIAPENPMCEKFPHQLKAKAPPRLLIALSKRHVLDVVAVRHKATIN